MAGKKKEPIAAPRKSTQRHPEKLTREEKKAKLAAAEARGRELEKRNPWRPPTYREEFCQIVIDIMKDGASMVEAAATIGVVRDTFTDWRRDHEKFRLACTRGLELCQMWWEKQARQNLIDSYADGAGSRFNDRLWNKNVSCRFRDDWADRKQEDEDAAIARLAAIASILKGPQ